jgi:hypothetical protein
MSGEWVKTATADWFFERVGRAALGEGACAQVTSFKLGYGWVDESTSPPTLSDLTGAETEIPGVFFSGSIAEGKMLASYSGGVLLCQCIVEAGDLLAAEKASAIGIYDQDGGLIAAAVFYPDWVTPDEEYRTNVYVNFPTSGAS